MSFSMWDLPPVFNLPFVLESFHCVLSTDLINCVFLIIHEGILIVMYESLYFKAKSCTSCEECQKEQEGIQVRECSPFMTAKMFDHPPSVLAHWKVVDVHREFSFLITSRFLLDKFCNSFFCKVVVCKSIVSVVIPNVGEGELDIGFSKWTQLLIDV